MDCPRIDRVSRDSRDTQTQWGWSIYMYTLTSCVYYSYIPRIVPGLPVYPGTPGILRRMHAGGLDNILLQLLHVPWHIMPRPAELSQDCPCIPGLLGYSQWGWTIYILLLHVYTIPIYPRIVPGLPVYPGTPGILRQSGAGQYTLHVPWYVTPIYYICQDCPRITHVSWDY